MYVKILEPTSVRLQPHRAGMTVRMLPVGEQVDLGLTVTGEGGQWITINLPDGRTGYLPPDAKVFKVRDVTVAQPGLDVYQSPVMGSAVLMSCKWGSTLRVTGLTGEGADQWAEVITQTGQCGFIMPGSRVTEVAQQASTPAFQQPQAQGFQRPYTPSYQPSNAGGFQRPTPNAYQAVGPRANGTDRDDRRADAMKNIAVGGLICLAGIVITAVSYSMASGGGRYFITWGAIVFGGIRFFKGLSQFIG
jgi:hypothetical protein